MKITILISFQSLLSGSTNYDCDGGGKESEWC